MISIHAARVGCDFCIFSLLGDFVISIHAARVGCDSALHVPLVMLHNFNPRSPSGLRPASLASSFILFNFNPRSPSGLRHLNILQDCPLMVISIHAARVGCDIIWPISTAFLIISIHAARVGCDKATLHQPKRSWHFNPRSPSGLRRIFIIVDQKQPKDFNPRSPSGLRHDWFLVYRLEEAYFNPRSPSGLRQSFSSPVTLSTLFQSTQPEWAATD